MDSRIKRPVSMLRTKPQQSHVTDRQDHWISDYKKDHGSATRTMKSRDTTYPRHDKNISQVWPEHIHEHSWPCLTLVTFYPPMFTRMSWWSRLGRYTEDYVDQPGLIIRKVRDTIEYCANSSGSVRRLGSEAPSALRSKGQRLRGEQGCDNQNHNTPLRRGLVLPTAGESSCNSIRKGPYRF